MKKVPVDIKWSIAAIAISWFFWGPADAYWALFLKSFGANYSQIGWLVSLGKLIPLLIALPIGILADKLSARKMVLWSLVFYFILPFIYYYAGLVLSVFILAFAILLNGTLQMIRNIGMQTYIKEKTPHHLEGKVWSLYEALTLGGWGIGLFIGAFLVLFLEFYQLFLLIPIGVLAMFIIYYKLKEPKKILPKKFPHIHKMSFSKRMKRGFYHLKTIDRRVFWMLIISFLCGITLGNMDIFIVLFAENINMGIMTIGLLMGFIYTSSFLASPMNWITQRIGRFHSLSLGVSIMLISLIMVFYFFNYSLIIIFIAFFIQYLAFRLVKPIRDGIIASYTPNDMQGEIGGIQWTVLCLANIIGAIIFGYVSDYFGIKYVFIISAGIYLIMLIGFVYGIFKYEHTVKDIKIPSHTTHLHGIHNSHFGIKKKR